MKSFLQNYTKNPYNVDYDRLTIEDIQVDSRLVGTNDVFIALVGHTVDSHQYINHVLEREASLVIADIDKKEMIEQSVSDYQKIVYVNNTRDFISHIMDEYYKHPSHQLNVYGVTGTNGKTTISTIINKILNYLDYKSALAGTIGVEYKGIKEKSLNTTPDAHTLQKLIRQIVDLSITDLVMEVSSIALTEKRVSHVDFSVAIFSNLSRDHLDFHKTMDNYLDAKGILFKQIKPTNARGQENYAILNADVPESKTLASYSRATVRTYTVKQGVKADYQASNINYQAYQTNFDLNYPGGKIQLTTNFLGDFNVSNTLAAVAALHSKGVGIKDIARALKEIYPAVGRFQIVSAPADDIKVIVDYAHTPNSLKRIISSVKSIFGGYVYTVFGCSGDRDVGKRPLMAQVGTDLSDFAFFTASNPRSEDLDQIFADMVEGLENDNYEIIKDRRQAVTQAILQAKPGETVIIAGKGHEDTQQVKGTDLPWDDVEIAKKALMERHTI